jgi:hypothetical protein
MWSHQWLSHAHRSSNFQRQNNKLLSTTIIAIQFDATWNPVMTLNTFPMTAMVEKFRTNEQKYASGNKRQQKIAFATQRNTQLMGKFILLWFMGGFSTNFSRSRREWGGHTQKKCAFCVITRNYRVEYYFSV